MVARTAHIYSRFNWADCCFFKFCYCSIRLLVVLMKRILSQILRYIRMVAKIVSYTITTILLLIVYFLLVIPYSWFLRPNKESWIDRNVSFTRSSFNKPW